MDAERRTFILQQAAPALYEDFLLNQHRYRHYWPEYSSHDFVEKLVDSMIGNQVRKEK